MKTTKICSLMLLSGALTLGIVSCGSDDPVEASTPGSSDTLYVGTKNAFPNGYMAAGPEWDSLKVDELGRVTAIYKDESKTTFTYNDGTRYKIVSATSGSFTIAIDNTEEVYCKFTLNSNGFINHVDETYPSKAGTDTWDFSYDSDGHMIQMKRSEGDNEVTDITYQNGNIVKVVMKDDNNIGNTTTISYTTTANTYGVMMFDNCFRIDMDEMSVAYIAGLLGKGTALLPASATEQTTRGKTYNYKFAWGKNSVDITNADGTYTLSW